MSVDEKQINDVVFNINMHLSLALNARDDLGALLRIKESINDQSVEQKIFDDAKIKIKTAAQGLIDIINTF